MSSKRPPRADALRNRAHLLSVAREVFAEQGLEVPIDEIAKRAELGIGTVYRHFPTKEALFEAIVLDQLEEFLGQVTERLKQEPDPEQALVYYLQKYLEAGAAKKDFIEALARTPGRSGPPPAIQKVFQQSREFLGALLQRAQQAKVIRADVGVEETLAMLHGVSAATASYGGPPEGKRRLFGLMFDGLRRTK